MDEVQAPRLVPSGHVAVADPSWLTTVVDPSALVVVCWDMVCSSRGR
jgi:hypothetical protein